MGNLGKKQIGKMFENWNLVKKVVQNSSRVAASPYRLSAAQPYSFTAASLHWAKLHCILSQVRN